MNPSVSIIVPAYNAERYLERCLESILQQSYRGLEVIVIDDGSTDDTPAIISHFAHKDGRLRHIRQDNTGVATARNKGIGLANGEYLMFVDADDYLDKDCLETYVSSLGDEGFDLVCGGFRRPDEGGKISSTVSLDPEGQWSPYYVEAVWAKLYRTDFIRREKLEFLHVAIGEDLFFTIPSVGLARSIKVISYVGYNYFINKQSVTSKNLITSSNVHFEETLDAILDEEERRGISVEGLELHVFVRAAVWFLLYTAGGDTWEQSQANLSSFISWLDCHLPNWRSDRFSAITMPKGDALQNRFATWLFVRHPRLFHCILHIYGGIGRVK